MTTGFTNFDGEQLSFALSIIACYEGCTSISKQAPDGVKEDDWYMFKSIWFGDWFTALEMTFYFKATGSTGITTVMPTEEQSEWYDLQGRRVNPATAETGIYIHKLGNETRKVLINR